MKLSYVAAGALVLILSLWMASGLLTDQSDNTAEAANAEAEVADTAMKVEFVDVSLKPQSRDVVLQGQLEPRRHLMLKAETSSTVGTIHISKGERVTSGAAILDLSLSGRDTDLREAQARVKSAASEQKAAAALRKQGLQSKVQLEQTQAQLEAARAQLDRIERDIENTQITAPFAGIINDVPVDVGELIDHGTVVAELVDDSRFLVTAQAAQQTVSQLKLGREINVELITGETLPGKLTFISAVASSDTRSFKIEAEVDNPDGAFAAGVSASMVIPVEQIEAVFITPSALALGENGELGVKIVDAESRVEFMPIKLVSTSLNGAWVTGIPDNSRVITLGQGFVNSGQLVEPVSAPSVTN